MILFLAFVLIAFHPVGWALLLLAIAALFAFAFLPHSWAVVAVVILALLLGARAVSELEARRQWREDDAVLRRAQLRRARRYLGR